MGFRTRRREREANLRKQPNESKEAFLLRSAPPKEGKLTLAKKKRKRNTNG